MWTVIIIEVISQSSKVQPQETFILFCFLNMKAVVSVLHAQIHSAILESVCCSLGPSSRFSTLLENQ